MQQGSIKSLVGTLLGSFVVVVVVLRFYSSNKNEHNFKVDLGFFTCGRNGRDDTCPLLNLRVSVLEGRFKVQRRVGLVPGSYLIANIGSLFLACNHVFTCLEALMF